MPEHVLYVDHGGNQHTLEILPNLRGHNGEKVAVPAGEMERVRTHHARCDHPACIAGRRFKALIDS